MSRNTRIDVEVNTNRAQNQLRELANETTRVNNQVNNSGSSNTGSSNSNKASAVNSSIDLLRKQSSEREKEIRAQFEHLRRGNLNEYSEFENRHKRGNISDSEFEDYRQGFHESQVNSFTDENSELSENQRRTNELIEELISRQDENTRAEVTASQRDNSEFGGKGGILRGLFNERAELMEGRMGAETDGELSSYNKRLAKINKLIGKKTKGGSVTADTITEGANIGSQIIGGGGGQAALGMLSKAGPYGMAAAAVLALAGGGIMLGNTRDKELANLTSYRALGDRDKLNESVKEGKFTRYGMESDEYINKRKELLLASGNYKSGSVDNTYDAIRLERGYGIESVSNLSQFERQDKYGKSTSDNILEMLNVLAEIRDGSISVDDLTLANEKAGLMNRLQGNFTAVQEKFDNKSVLGLMTAFEKLGGEGKDQRAGDFISGTQNALREGGSKNLMLLKYQFAAQAHPELANDPAALSRMIEEGTDGDYMSQTLKGLKSLSGNNKQNQYFLFKEFFQSSGLTASMRDKLMKAADSDEILGNIAGKGLTNSGSFNQSNADAYAYSKTQGTEEIWGDIKNEVSNIGDWFKDLFRSPVDVNVKNKDKSATTSSQPKIPGN